MLNRMPPRICPTKEASLGKEKTSFGVHHGTGFFREVVADSQEPCMRVAALGQGLLKIL